MAVVSPERLRDDIVRLAHRGADVRDFSLGAARLLARSVPFDGVCVLTMDPATLVPTGEVVENGLPPSANARMAELELRGGDVNAFADLAGSGRRAATLSEATGGDLDRSRRHRELKAPHGFGDELRAVLAGDGAMWGGLTLLRGADRPAFAVDDAPLVAWLAPVLAEGLRRAVLAGALGSSGDRAPGVVLLAPDGTVVADHAARRWLDELPASVVTAVAARARVIVDGAHDGTSAIARARVLTASGAWLVVRGSALDDGRTAVTLEPARPHELAPLVAEAYGLTERERAVTQLVARGQDTAAIARRLHVSPWTVQDHLKAIFEKVGVRTRGELVAHIFLGRDAPTLTDERPDR